MAESALEDGLDLQSDIGRILIIGTLLRSVLVEIVFSLFSIVLIVQNIILSITANRSQLLEKRNSVRVSGVIREVGEQRIQRLVCNGDNVLLRTGLGLVDFLDMDLNID